MPPRPPRSIELAANVRVRCFLSPTGQTTDARALKRSINSYSGEATTYYKKGMTARPRRPGAFLVPASLLLLLLLFLAFSAAAPWQQQQQHHGRLMTAAAAPDDGGGGGFVGVDGTQFVVGAGGGGGGNKQTTVYFSGFNAYWLMLVASDPARRAKVVAAFRQASDHGLNLARTWAFSDGGHTPLQVSPGVYDEAMFQVGFGSSSMIDRRLGRSHRANQCRCRSTAWALPGFVVRACRLVGNSLRMKLFGFAVCVCVCRVWTS